MRIYTMNELQQLNRVQLLELHQDISRHLMVLSDDTNERREALENLSRIQRVLNMRGSRPMIGRYISPAP